MAASGRTTIFAPLTAASSTSLVSLARFASTAPRSPEHCTAATFTVFGRVVGRASPAFATVVPDSTATRRIDRHMVTTIPSRAPGAA